MTDGGRLKFSMLHIVTDERFLFIYLFRGYLMTLSVSYTTQRRIRDKWRKKGLERACKESAVPETEIGSKLVHVL